FTAASVSQRRTRRFTPDPPAGPAGIGSSSSGPLPLRLQNQSRTQPMKNNQLMTYFLYLKLSYFREYHQSLAKEAVEKNWSQLDFLSRLAEGETLRRKDHATKRRIQAARFPVIKTLEQFNWTWPKKINRPQVQNLFRLSFPKEKANVIFMGGVGLGKTHLAAALAYEACLAGYTALHATAIDIVNTLAAAQSTNRLKSELKKYLSPQILLVDERSEEHTSELQS